MNKQALQFNLLKFSWQQFQCFGSIGVFRHVRRYCSCSPSLCFFVHPFTRSPCRHGSEPSRTSYPMRTVAELSRTGCPVRTVAERSRTSCPGEPRRRQPPMRTRRAWGSLRLASTPGSCRRSGTISMIFLHPLENKATRLDLNILYCAGTIFDFLKSREWSLGVDSHGY